MKYKYLLFDLDNTLYPSTAAIDKGITHRMLSFIASYLHISYEEAIAKRNSRLPFYGTTLEWLRTEEGLKDIHSFFNAVHPPEEIEEIPFDAHLRPFLQSLHMPMAILTNAPMVHAKRILDFLNVTDLFTGIYDVECNNLKGKPYPQAFYNALEGSNFSLKETLFFDDHKKYTDGYQVLGGQAILVQHPQNAGISHPLDTQSYGDSPNRNNSHVLKSLGSKDPSLKAQEQEPQGPEQITIGSIYEIPELLKKLE